jgi:hypothetical protein
MIPLVATVTTAIRRTAADAERATAAAGEVFEADFENLALHYLRQAGTIPLQNLIDLVTEEALQTEILLGGWAFEVGDWATAVFRQEASWAIQRLVGRALVHENGRMVSLVVPAGRVSSRIVPAAGDRAERHEIALAHC